MSKADSIQLPATVISKSEISQFLVREASLLDDQDFRAWNELFTVEGIYWIPSRRGQTDPLNEVSHMYEDSLLRDIRATRLERSAPSLQPMPVTSHLISNCAIDGFDEERRIATTRSRFIVTQYHRDDVAQFSGECIHKLIIGDSGNIKIEMKRVNLVNCEGMIGDILVCI